MAKKKSKKRSKKLKLMGGPMALPRELEQSLLAALAGQQQQGSKSIAATSTNKTSSDESKPKASKKAQQDPLLIRQKLQDAVDRKIRKNDILRGRMESLDIKKAALAIRIMEEKKKKGPQGGVKATYEQHCKIQQKYRVLSGVLDRLLVRCSKAGHVNDCLINEINEKRKERMIFEQMQARLKRKFHEKQRQMAKLLQLSNEFNESRLKARNDLETLIEEEEKEKKREEEEYDRLDEVIQRQENLQNDLQTASLKRRAHQLKEQIGSGTLDPEEEARLRARLSALNAKIERKSNEIEVVQTDTMWSYEEAFQQILDEASTESHSPTLAEVVTQFVQNYDESFGLLNYVQLVQDENYKIEARLATVRADFQKYAREQGKHDMNKERIKNELNSRLENLNMNNEKLQAALEQKEATLSLLVQSIERLARQFNGHGIITQEKEIGSETSTRSLMHCLGQIELKTIEMCQHLERSILAEQHEEEKQRSKLSGLDGNNTKSRNVLLLTKDSTTHSAGLYGGPQSPVRSRKEATVKIPRFGKDTVKAVFDSRSEHSGNILDGPEQEDDMRVISIDELRSMAQATLVKPAPSAKHKE